MKPRHETIGAIQRGQPLPSLCDSIWFISQAAKSAFIFNAVANVAARRARLTDLRTQS